jgi:hypothetical protein
MMERGRRTMESSARRNEPNILDEGARVDKARYRPIRLIGLLLILQVIGLGGIGVYQATGVDWDEIVSIDSQGDVSILLDQSGSLSDASLEQAGEVVVFVVLFLPPAFLMLLAGLSFLLLKRRGWLLAAIAQGLSLGICLFFYSELEQSFVYPIMLYCILMVFYLNSHDVRVVFHSRRDPARRNLKARHGS